MEIASVIFECLGILQKIWRSFNLSSLQVHRYQHCAVRSLNNLDRVVGFECPHGVCTAEPNAADAVS